MEFTISRATLQKEIAFLQGVVEKKNVIPQISNILVEAAGANRISFTGTDLDLTARTEAEAAYTSFGAVAVQAKKLFDISRLLPDAPVIFRVEKNDWVTVECQNFRSKIPGSPRENFPEVPSGGGQPFSFPAKVLKSFIERTIFAITQEESRYTLSGAKFIIDKTGAKMVTTDGHRLAYIARREETAPKLTLDALIPRKALSELNKLAAVTEGDFSFSATENHLFFNAGSRLLISRKLSGQFPNYEMVMPRNNDKALKLAGTAFNQVLKRVALMADERSRSVRLHLTPGQLQVSAQSAEEGEAAETIALEYQGEELEVGFNAQYLQDFLTVVGDAEIIFEFKDGNSQVQMRPAVSEFDYKYVCMPMRL